MIPLSAASLALAGGNHADGHSHGPETAPTVTATGLRVPASSTNLDAVLVLPAEPGPARLLVADSNTSAPIELTSANLTLSGPASVTASFSGAGGVYSGPLDLPAPGSYAGTLVVEGPGGPDLLGVSGIATPEEAPHEHAAAAWAGGTCAAFAVGLVLLGVGFALGRWRRGAITAVVALFGISAAGKVSAHGGEDHGAAKLPTSSGAGLELRLESQFLVGLRTQRAAMERFEPRTLGLGSLTTAPGGAATLRAAVSGTLEAPPGGFPAPGSEVRAGQVLALLRETPSTADRAALVGQKSDAEARLAGARGALRLAQRDLERASSLGTALSERERVERENAVEVATAEVQAAQRASAAGGAAIPLTAPISGRIQLGSARPGEQVSEGSELFRLFAPAALWVEVRVPEGSAVPSGGAAVVTLPSLPGRSFPAVVLDGGLAADPRTGTLAVTLALEPDPALRPGLAASAWIPSGEAEDALVVPDDAVVESAGATLLFVKTGPERFEAREVALGLRNGTTWEVHGGLRPGERIVTSGTSALKDLAGR